MTLSRVRRWARRRCLTLLPVGTTCCAAELDAALGPAFDPDHHGLQVVDLPEMADVLVVAGRLSEPMGEVIRDLIERMPPPARIVAFGACAVSGGVLAGTGETVDLSSIAPVDLRIAGCSPPPRQLYEALERLRQD